jgi:hypothetical protein
MGEQNIRDFLIKNNISYEPQYKFEDCKYIHKLAFDYAVFVNDKLFILIEFDGIQHFESRSFFGGEEGLKEIQRNDNIKNEYCKNNNIPLLRIAYTNYKNIDEILEKFLLYN